MYKEDLQLEDGVKYTGEALDGLPHGQGTMTYPDGTKHVGEFRNGLPNGQGTGTYPLGSVYVGEYKDGKPWNAKGYDKDSNIIAKWVNGVKQ